MAGELAICAVCADPGTVRAHILPRALFHDDARSASTIILGGVEEGYRITQSGKWDSRILCAVHEAQLGAADAYAISLCRTYRQLADEPAGTPLPNPTPSLLVDFALASIWRMAASRTRGRPGHVLGHHANLIEGRLFGPGEGCDPSLFMERFEIDGGEGRPLVFCMLPSPLRHDHEVWHFVVAGLRFEVDLRRHGPSSPGAHNGASEIVLGSRTLRSPCELRDVHVSLLRMSAKRPARWSGSRGRSPRPNTEVPDDC